MTLSLKSKSVFETELEASTRTRNKSISPYLILRTTCPPLKDMKKTLPLMISRFGQKKWPQSRTILSAAVWHSSTAILNGGNSWNNMKMTSEKERKLEGTNTNAALLLAAVTAITLSTPNTIQDRKAINSSRPKQRKKSGKPSATASLSSTPTHISTFLMVNQDR